MAKLCSAFLRMMGNGIVFSLLGVMGNKSAFLRLMDGMLPLLRWPGCARKSWASCAPLSPFSGGQGLFPSGGKMCQSCFPFEEKSEIISDTGDGKVVLHLPRWASCAHLPRARCELALPVFRASAGVISRLEQRRRRGFAARSEKCLET